MPSHADRSARAQLAALVAGGGQSLVHAGEDFGMPEEPREAAVLILFGVLDGLPSDREAQSAAVSRDLDVLLLARATTLRAHPGQVAFPGGRIDPDDHDAVGAALREAVEETGLDPSGVDVLGALEPLPLERSGHLVTPVVGWWSTPSAVRAVDAAESADVFRVPVADLLNPANRGTTVLRRDGHVWRGPAFTIRGSTQEHVLWGFTAMILSRMFDALGWSEPWDQSRELALPL